MNLAKSRKTVYFIAVVSVFSAIAIVLYVTPIFNFPLPIFPGFLKIHLDEVPVFVAGYAGGPLAALAVIIIKTLPKLFMTSTLTVGEFCDLLLSLAFVMPAAILFKYKKGIGWIIVGILISFITQIVVAMVVTTFIILPVYIFVFKMSEEQLLSMIQVVIPQVTNLNKAYMFFVALPFNAIKNIIVIVPTIIVVLPLYKLIRNFNYYVVGEREKKDKITQKYLANKTYFEKQLAKAKISGNSRLIAEWQWHLSRLEEKYKTYRK